MSNKKKNAQSQNLSNGNDDSVNALAILGELLLLFLKVVYAIGESIVRLVVPPFKKPVKGSVVLITGAGHGIGRELALQYASEGATVVCWDVDDKGNRDTINAISRLGYPQAHGYICDVSSRENVEQTAAKVRKEVGEIDVLINNAGIMVSRPFLEHSTADIERTMNINVMAHFWILQAFLPAMIKRNQGHIVALSSCAGIMGLRNLVPYCASKYAVRGMMHALYEELRTNPKNQIKTTLIYPYIVDTGLCKVPVIRFPKLMPLLNPTEVAKYIMKAQRRNMYETTIPRHILGWQCLTHLLPIKAQLLLSDFAEIYTGRDP